jgi:hypothetical protein
MNFDQRRVPLALFCLFGTVLCAHLTLVGFAGSSIPFWDQWDGEARTALIPYFSGPVLHT